MKPLLHTAAALLLLNACSDYTDTNFGTRDELYQPSETGKYELTLSKGDYPTLVNELNLSRARQLAADTIYATRDDGTTDSTTILTINHDVATILALENVAIDLCLNDRTPAELYLPEWIDSHLVWATDGATATVIVKEDTQPFDPTYLERVTTPTLTPGSYLLVPKETDLAIYSRGEDTDELIATTPLGLRYDQQHLLTSTNIERALLNINTAGQHYTLTNSHYSLICHDGASTTLQAYQDLGSLDDEDQSLWDIINTGDGHYTLQNIVSHDYILFDTTDSLTRACPNLDDPTKRPFEAYRYVTPNHADNTQALRAGKKDNVVKAKYLFVKRNGHWQIKDSYFDAVLTGEGTSTKADEVKEKTGFTLAIVDMPASLSYVWKLDNIYGLRSSAYVSGVNNPTEAWAISPDIDLSSAVNPILKFDHAQKYAGDPTQELTVWMTLDNIDDNTEIDPEEHQWTQLTIPTDNYPDGTNWDFITLTLPLTQAAGSNHMRFAFRYISTSQASATWEVKNITVKEGK